MFDSFLTLIGSPQINRTSDQVAANVTIDENNSIQASHQAPRRRYMTSNSTAIDAESWEGSYSSKEHLSSTFSPVKTKRDNSMSSSPSLSSSSECVDQNLSVLLKHNIDEVNYDDPIVQKVAIHYLLEKVRDLETLFIQSGKEKKTLQDEISALYKQNDVLSAENVTMKDLISSHDDRNRALSVELDAAKKEIEVAKSAFNATKIRCQIAMSKIYQDVEDIFGDMDYLNDRYLYLLDNQAMDDEVYKRLDDLEIAMTETQEKSGRNQIAIEIIKEEIADIQKDTLRLDKNITVTNQYNRRQNLVIEGIPDNVPQGKLENTCLNILHDIGFPNVSSYEVVGCHRLRRRTGDKTTPTIIRFVNRKITEFCMRNRWRLKHLRTTWDLNFREDLCDSNLDILTKCEEMQKQGLLAKVFTANGFVIVVKKNKDRPIKLVHIKDLDNLLSLT